MIVDIDRGYDVQQAKRIEGYAKEIIAEEGMKINKIHFATQHMTELAHINREKKEITVSNNLEQGKILRFGDEEYEIIAHELGHNYDYVEKDYYAKLLKKARKNNARALETPDKYPGVVKNIKRLEEKVMQEQAAYNRNKTLNDELNNLYKEFRKNGKFQAFSPYAWRGGFGEFVAECFAKVKVFQHIGIKIKKEGIPYRVYEVLKKF